MKVLALISTSKINGNFKNDHLLVEKVRAFHCPTAIATSFSIKFVLDATVKDSGSWNITNLGLCRNSVALNISFKSKWVFWKIKVYKKCKFVGSGPKWKWKYIFPDHHGQFSWRQIREIKQNYFLWNVLHLIFCNFVAKLSKFTFWVSNWVLVVISKLFRDLI